MNKPEFPFSSLGRELRAARIKQRKTIAEASGAIELSESILTSFEKGSKRPAEDTLMVLISYLGFKEEEAGKLWELAGYRDTEDDVIDFGQQIAVTIPGDLRVVYTDMVHVLVNDFGVIMNFMQNSGNQGQPLAIARVGMSKDHAKSVIEVMQKSLAQAEKGKQPKSQKLLDSSKQKNQSVKDTPKQ